MFSLIVVSISLAIWILFVIPKMAVFFRELDIPIPVYTQFLVRLGESRGEIVKVLLSLFGLVFFLFVFLRISKRVKYLNFVNSALGYIFTVIPLFGRVIKEYNQFLIASFMSSLISAGLNMEMVMMTLRNVISNGYYIKALEEATEKIREGAMISQSFRETRAFSSLFLRYLTVGERTGTLDEQLNFIARFYRDKIESFLMTLPKIIEPLLLMVIGGIIVFMIVAVFVPIYTTIGKVIKSL